MISYPPSPILGTKGGGNVKARIKNPVAAAIIWATLVIVVTTVGFAYFTANPTGRLNPRGACFLAGAGLIFLGIRRVFRPTRRF